MLDALRMSNLNAETMASRPRISMIAAGIAVALTALATLWLLLWPYSYSGISVSSNGGEPVRTSASLIAVNGYRVVLVLLAPCALTLFGFLAIRNSGAHRLVGKIAIWLPAVALFLFCVVGAFSVGLFYFPGAVASLVAAILSGRRSRKRVPPPFSQPA